VNTSELRVILIGGSSHAGKSTLAQSLASRLDWHCISTDSLARHPGRPWGKVRPHVARHYLSLSVDALFEDVLRHYARLWPDIQSLITAHASDPSAQRLILEGSALWPESVATLRLEGVGAIWLTASDSFFQKRMYKNSGFDQASVRGQAMIEKFLQRTLRYNTRMIHVLRRLDLPYVNVEEASSLDELMDSALRQMIMLNEERSA
jgi:2-phosphoglycerate kinase